jgi:hypothetical protein
MTFAEELYMYLQGFDKWGLWHSRLVRVLESYRPEARLFIQQLEFQSSANKKSSTIEERWAVIEPLLPTLLPDVLTALNF